MIIPFASYLNDIQSKYTASLKLIRNLSLHLVVASSNFVFQIPENRMIYWLSQICGENVLNLAIPRKFPYLSTAYHMLHMSSISQKNSIFTPLLVALASCVHMWFMWWLKLVGASKKVVFINTNTDTHFENTTDINHNAHISIKTHNWNRHEQRHELCMLCIAIVLQVFKSLFITCF